jgi:hypothetical protein
MALQAPIKFVSSIGKEQVSKVIWDLGASVSFSCCKSDFVGELNPPPIFVKLKGLAKGLKIKGMGYVMWAVLDMKGMLRMLKLPAYYVPKTPVHLLSTTSLLQTYEGETIHMEPHQLTLSGDPNDFTHGAVVVHSDPCNNLPTCQIYSYGNPDRAVEALSTTLSVVSNENANLTEAQKELLCWHFRLGHLAFQKAQFLMRSGVLALSKEQHHLHTAACLIHKPPKCAACLYRKQKRHPVPGTVSSVVHD